jgi:hypothetical protein
MECIPLCKILTTEANCSLNKRVLSKASVFFIFRFKQEQEEISFDSLVVMNLEFNFFWDVMPCSMSTFYKDQLPLCPIMKLEAVGFSEMLVCAYL